MSSFTKKHFIHKDSKFLVDPRYKIKTVLGKGTYGTVCSAIDTKSMNGISNQAMDDEEVKIAIKKVSNIFDKEVLLKRAVRELKLLRHFKGHRNIINLLDLEIVYLEPYDGLYCFQELADYDLARVIYSSIQFSEFHIQSFVYQILCGLKYIHSADVIHRDLKPGNVLVNIQGCLKICDFGLARGINSNYLIHKTSPITNYVATRWYRAPELILSHSGRYGKAVDMWAVGCILAELYGRRPLFMGKDKFHQIHEIMKIIGTPNQEIIIKNKWNLTTQAKPQFKKMDFKSIYPYASKDAFEILESLLSWESHRRFTVERCLEQNFFLKVRDADNEPCCDKIFDFSFESANMSMSNLKMVLLEEVDSFKRDRMAV